MATRGTCGAAAGEGAVTGHPAPGGRTHGARVIGARSARRGCQGSPQARARTRARHHAHTRHAPWAGRRGPAP
jgi:hypothetical protein